MRKNAFLRRAKITSLWRSEIIILKKKLNTQVWWLSFVYCQWVTIIDETRKIVFMTVYRRSGSTIIMNSSLGRTKNCGTWLHVTIWNPRRWRIQSIQTICEYFAKYHSIGFYLNISRLTNIFEISIFSINSNCLVFFFLIPKHTSYVRRHNFSITKRLIFY